MVDPQYDMIDMELHDLSEQNDGLKKENERYRKALDKIRKTYAEVWSADKGYKRAFEIAYEALEG